MSDRMTQGEAGYEVAQGSIYESLASHQRMENWPNRQRLAQFQAWGERYSVHFKLDVSEIALCLDSLPVTCFGHFRVGHNGFGLKGEIAINARYLEVRPTWQVLGTLLHEHLHAWQHVHGNPSKHDHHNLEFRRKAAEFGLLIDRRGVTDYLLESPFMDLLQQHGVEVPTEAEEDEATGQRGRLVRRMLGRPGRMRGKSSLAKWKCDCSSVRCGKADLRAQCLKCGKEFRREEEPPSHGADKPTPNAD